jgi:hypothetical protein
MIYDAKGSFLRRAAYELGDIHFDERVCGAGFRQEQNRLYKSSIV